MKRNLLEKLIYVLVWFVIDVCVALGLALMSFPIFYLFIWSK